MKIQIHFSSYSLDWKHFSSLLLYFGVIEIRINKNAFQYDAYRLLVARISQHALLRGGTWSGGQCTWSWGGVCLVPGVYLVPGGCTWSQGVYLILGCTWSQGGAWSRGIPGCGGWGWQVPGPRGCTWSRG